MKKSRHTPTITAATIAAVTMTVVPAAAQASPPEDGGQENAPEPTPETTKPKPAPTTTSAAPPTTTENPPAPGTTVAPPAPGTTVAPPAPGTTVAPPGGSTTVPSTTTAPTSTVPTSSVPPTTGPPAPAQLGVPVPIGGDYGAILMTIRTLESGNRYQIPKNKGGASGAYQFIDRTWNNFGGYPSAYLAPPAVQDQKALADVQRFLAQWGGDVSMVPVMWYYPKAAFNSALMDQVPMPGAGNTLTIREYQYKWMRIYKRFSGKDFDLSAFEPQAIQNRLGLPPLVTGGVGELQQVAFPVLGPSTVVADNPCSGPDCEPGQDALVTGKKLQPVLTAFEGVVTAVKPGDPATGEVAVTVTDRIGRTYTYSGFNSASDGNETNAALSLSANAKVGASVRAGTILGFMGETDPTTTSVGPHIRLTIRDQYGVRLDAARLVNEARAREACRLNIGLWSMPANAAIGIDPDYPSFEPITVDVSENGSFTIHSDGTVTAIGEGALVSSDQPCAWIPDQPFGPGANGQPMPEELSQPIELPVSFYIAGAAADDTGAQGLR